VLPELENSPPLMAVRPDGQNTWANVCAPAAFVIAAPATTTQFFSAPHTASTRKP
jgi:hypothetical protein